MLLGAAVLVACAEPPTREISQAQGALEAARAAFEQMTPAEGEGRALGLYHQGRVLLALAKPDDAKKRFDEALTAKPDPMLKAQIEGRLGGLESAK